MNLSIQRAFRFGDIPARAAGPAQAGRTVAAEKRYTVNVGLRVLNLFNRTNVSTPTGNLSSSLFGVSTSSAGTFGGGIGNPAAGNCRLELQLRFSF